MALHYNNQLQYRSATCCILIPLQVMVTTGRRRPSSWYPPSAGRENTHMLPTSPTAGQGLGDSGVETANVACAHGDRASDSHCRLQTRLSPSVTSHTNCTTEKDLMENARRVWRLRHGGRSRSFDAGAWCVTRCKVWDIGNRRSFLSAVFVSNGYPIQGREHANTAGIAVSRLNQHCGGFVGIWPARPQRWPCRGDCQRDPRPAAGCAAAGLPAAGSWIAVSFIFCLKRSCSFRMAQHSCASEALGSSEAMVATWHRATGQVSAITYPTGRLLETKHTPGVAT
jgi:hypothetical protein